MKIGVPAELKEHEYRVAITPPSVHELMAAGHAVYVERGAGLGSAIPDADYAAAGAKLLDFADYVWDEAELVLKVKEPVPAEYSRMRRDQVLFTYLHLAASAECTQTLLDSGITAVAYETVQLPDGTLPLLYPMSEVAGRMAPQAGSHHLQREAGGRGVLMGGVSGAHPAKVTILGAGVAGMNAAAVAVGMWADVVVLDKDVDKLRRLDRLYQGRLRTVAANAYEISDAVTRADLVIGAVLVAGAKAPKLVSSHLVSAMKPGAVLVDLSVDQGGCFADTRPTTHAAPTFPVHGTTFYCVSNMPGAVPHTSTYALTNVTLPHIHRIGNHGLRAVAHADPALRFGINTVDGATTHPSVAAAHGLDYVEPDVALN